MVEHETLRQAADREKRFVALTSVLAAVFLTGMKLVVGLSTGSLGILSEAAHSALDLIAAGVTYFAVRISGRPADREHSYGHGKIENLSALFETALLLLTCVWIIYEALSRLLFRHVRVDASVWGFVIMAVSIAIDFTRSRALARAAKKYDSQALEADALHFSTDIWSSTVVIVGLFLVWISDTLKLPWLARADAIAALGVAAIVVYISLQLGSRTVGALLDAVAPQLREDVARAAAVPGVIDVKQVRVRKSGPEAFADVTLTVSRDTPLERAHGIAQAAEEGIREVLPNADVVVHVDPVRPSDEALPETVRLLAAREGLAVHDIRLYDVAGQRRLDLHVEVDDSLKVAEAHEQVSRLEEALNKAFPGVDLVFTHIEPARNEGDARRASSRDEQAVWRALKALPETTGIDCRPHSVIIDRVDGALSVSFHCILNPSASITAAHEATERIEQTLRREVPHLGRVLIHVEPPEK